jgi:hypothetical protein
MAIMMSIFFFKVVTVYGLVGRDTSVSEKNILPPFSLEDRGSM